MSRFVPDKYKRNRVEVTISRNLSDIICLKMKNNLTSLASINEVVFNDDMSVATVYVVHLDKSKTDVLVSFLNKKQGEIKTMLAKTLDIYKCPNLVFKKDDLYEKASKIDDLLDKVNNEKMQTLKDLKKKKKS